MHPEKMVVRRYSLQDRHALRKICCDTAYFGEPCEAFFPDRELVADLVMNYYTDYEPEHTWVAEYEGGVIGYISACFDGHRYTRDMFFKVIPLGIMRALPRGKIWSVKTCRLIAYNLKSFILKETGIASVSCKKFPVHIHMNIREGFRRQGIGSNLLKILLDEVKRESLPGIQIKPLRNEPSFPFFEKHGFKRIDCKRVKTWEVWLNKKPLYYMRYVMETDNDEEKVCIHHL